MATVSPAPNTLAPDYPLKRGGARPLSLTRARAARLLGASVFYSLVVLVALTAIPYGTVEPWWEALFQCAIFALATLWAVEGALRREWRVGGTRALVPLALLAAFVFLQAATSLSADPYETRRVAFKLLAYVLALALLLTYTSTPRRLRSLAHVVVWVGVLSALFGVARQLVPTGVSEKMWPQLAQQAGFAQFVNRNHFAFLMEMALGLTAGLVLGGGVRRARLPLYLVAVALMWVALLLSRSRGGVLGLLGMSFFLALAFGWARREERGREKEGFISRLLWRVSRSLVLRGALLLCLAGTVAVGVVWIGGEPVASRLKAVPDEFGEEAARAPAKMRRVEMWRATARLIMAHPLTGVGFGGYWIAITEHHRATGNFSLQQAHNDYLELIASGGLVGAALVVWFAACSAAAARKRLLVSSNAFRRAVCYGALAGLFAVAVHSLVDFGLHVTVNALAAIALLTLATVRIHEERPGE
ncbi:MAG: O-antigen ligase family protein [Pyrinomonadaceae bacterium]